MGIMWYDFIIFPMALALITLSIIILVSVYKKVLSKVHIVYPSYYLSILVLSILFAKVVYHSYGLERTLIIYDNILKFYIIFFVFDVIFPLFMIVKFFPEFVKKIMKLTNKVLGI